MSNVIIVIVMAVDMINRNIMIMGSLLAEVMVFRGVGLRVIMVKN